MFVLSADVQNPGILIHVETSDNPEVDSERLRCRADLREVSSNADHRLRLGECGEGLPVRHPTEHGNRGHGAIGQGAVLLDHAYQLRERPRYTPCCHAYCVLATGLLCLSKAIAV